MKFLIGLLLITNVAIAEEVTYNWKPMKVIDGDTIKFEAPWVPKPMKPEISIRVLGIDTPEKKPRSKCEKENALAQRASSFTKEMVSKSKLIQVNPIDWDKYGGRIDGDIIIDGKSLANELITNGLARPYHGEAKSSWCK